VVQEFDVASSRMKQNQSPQEKSAEEKQIASKGILNAVLIASFALVFIVLRSCGFIEVLPLKLGFFEFLFRK